MSGTYRHVHLPSDLEEVLDRTLERRSDSLLNTSDRANTIATFRSGCGAGMAWMRMMGAESVAYHRETVLGRADDHPGAALAYYACRGETPLRWGGSGAERLGLAGTVEDEAYEAIFGPGGAVDPALGVRLVATKRPGMELVVAAHKSVALLGLMGRAEHMHELLGHRTRRHARLPRRPDPAAGRPAGPGRGGHADVGAGVRPHPSRHVPGR